jgi:hypothetical protein
MMGGGDVVKALLGRIEYVDGKGRVEGCGKGKLA